MLSPSLVLVLVLVLLLVLWPPPNMSRSSESRNAERVLPDPVGATTSVWAPLARDAHAPSCAGVGRSNAPRNHEAVAGWNRSSASDMNT